MLTSPYCTPQIPRAGAGAGSKLRASGRSCEREAGQCGTRFVFVEAEEDMEDMEKGMARHKP